MHLNFVPVDPTDLPPIVVCGSCGCLVADTEQDRRRHSTKHEVLEFHGH